MASTLVTLLLVTLACVATDAIAKSNRRVIGGYQVSDKKDITFFVQLKMYTCGSWHILPCHYYTCGGALISARTAVTAANCFWAVTDIRVHFGSIYQFFGEYRDADRWVKHGGHDNRLLANDVAMIHWSKAISIGVDTGVQPIAFAQFPLKEYEINYIQFVGIGVTDCKDSSSNAAIAHWAYIGLERNRTCQDTFDFHIQHRDMLMCSMRDRANGKGACFGDHGGPLFLGPITPKSKGFRLVGIYSKTLKTKKPGTDEEVEADFFMSAGYFKTWILKTSDCLIQAGDDTNFLANNKECDLVINPTFPPPVEAKAAS